MSTVLNVLRKISGYKILESLNSPHHGQIDVIQEFGKIRITSGGLTQSGDSIDQVWGKTLSHLKLQPQDKILILGLGSGTLARMIHNREPNCSILGVDIDPIMVNLGHKYFSLSQLPHLNVAIQDAKKFISLTNLSFSYIFVDIYKGSHIPNHLDTKSFFSSLSKRLDPKGSIFINRLFYNSETRAQAQKTISLLDKIPSTKITLTRVFTNLIICLQNT